MDSTCTFFKFLYCVLFNSIIQNCTCTILGEYEEMYTTLFASSAEKRIIQSKKLSEINLVPNSRIVGGVPAQINEYPYNAQYGGCGAAIIAKNWCLTAAHCEAHAPAVKVGATKWNSGITHTISDYIQHPSWMSSLRNRFEYDFQLLKLVNPITFNANAQPIVIGTDSDASAGNHLIVTGWGNTQYNGKQAESLRVVRVPIVTRAACQKVRAENYEYIGPAQICAGYWDGGKDACQGDSGGPAVSNGKLVGLVSYGFECARAKVYGVYSYVPHVSDWISKTTGI